jgi:hypothetical protein
MAQLDQLVLQPQALGYRLRYVSAFPNRRILRRFIEDIAWGTDVWVASEPEGVIHFGHEDEGQTTRNKRRGTFS